ncbi:MAG: hypothetical protein ABI395_08340 [Sphingobium sp.]
MRHTPSFVEKLMAGLHGKYSLSCRVTKAARGNDDAKNAENWPKAGFVLTTTGCTPISGITVPAFPCVREKRVILRFRQMKTARSGT